MAYLCVATLGFIGTIWENTGTIWENIYCIYHIRCNSVEEMSTEKQISNKNNNIKCSTCLKIIETSLLRDPSLEYGFIWGSVHLANLVIRTLWWSKIAMEQIGTGPMFVLGTPLCTTYKWVAANAVPRGLCVFVTFWVLYIYIYMGWGGVGY